MEFNIYKNKLFLDIISSSYNLQFFVDPTSAIDKYAFLQSRYFFKAKNLFSLPFAFYQTNDETNRFSKQSDWEEICDASKRQGVKVRHDGIGPLGIESEKIVANNPILLLDHSVDPLFYYGKNHRQNVQKERNKALRLEVKVFVSKEISDLQQFYNIMANQYIKKHRMVFQPYELFFKLMQSGLATLIIAKSEEKVIGGILCINDGKVFHYNWGVREKFSNLNIGTLIIDFAVNYALTRGFEFFDFGSTPLSDNDLFNYKMKWGAKNSQVYRVSTSTSVKAIDLNDSYKTSRYFYSMVPVQIAKALMPKIVPLLV